MPIKIKNDLPVREILERENIFVVDEDRAIHQDIRPLEVCILNLMPLKEATELQLLRSLSNTPLQIDVSFMYMSSHEAAHTSMSHLQHFYRTFEELKDNTYDGLIITGAPVEMLPFEEVDYWEELCRVFRWTDTNVTSTFHICWGAQAGVYFHYGIDKRELKKKLSGVYHNRVLNRKVPLVRGFDDDFLMPHSRFTETPAEEIHACGDLLVLAESDEAGIMLCMSGDGRRIFSMAHAEYDRVTLNEEYLRDTGRGMEIEKPVGYYPEDDPSREPPLMWRAHCNTLYTNWLNYYVYQATPYQWGQILTEGKRKTARDAVTEPA
ncbi:MAG: homoserine O-succinyltransferase [Lachnospiraceae bacterium]|nr:homoserine O-succinyltransferase [Lachnospiraceae bacterium]